MEQAIYISLILSLKSINKKYEASEHPAGDTKYPKTK